MLLVAVYSIWFLAISLAYRSALQRQNAENLNQIFPEKEYRGLSPNFHIHVSVSELYIPTMGLPFLREEICGPILGIYKSLTDTWMWNWGWGHAIPRKGIYKRNCRCSVGMESVFYPAPWLFLPGFAEATWGVGAAPYGPFQCNENSYIQYISSLFTTECQRNCIRISTTIFR